MKVCIVGSGGREHALASACDVAGAEVVVAPGNAGIPWSTPVGPEEVDADLFVIGPERPLVGGWPIDCGPRAGWSWARAPTVPASRAPKRG